MATKLVAVGWRPFSAKLEFHAMLTHSGRKAHLPRRRTVSAIDEVLYWCMSMSELSPPTNGMVSTKAGGFLSREFCAADLLVLEVTGNGDELLIDHVPFNQRVHPRRIRSPWSGSVSAQGMM